MTVDFYRQILNMFPEEPLLEGLNNNDLVPNYWPLKLKSILNITGTFAKFEVADLKTSKCCTMKSRDMINKLKSLGSGQIVFLYNSIARGNEFNNIEIEVKSFYTLKEVNDGIVKLDKKDPGQSVGSLKPTKGDLKDKKVLESPCNDKQNYDSRWRTLAERWHKQGKLVK